MFALFGMVTRCFHATRTSGSKRSRSLNHLNDGVTLSGPWPRARGPSPRARNPAPKTAVPPFNALMMQRTEMVPSSLPNMFWSR